MLSPPSLNFFSSLSLSASSLFTSHNHSSVTRRPMPIKPIPRIRSIDQPHSHEARRATRLAGVGGVRRCSLTLEEGKQTKLLNQNIDSGRLEEFVGLYPRSVTTIMDPDSVILSSSPVVAIALAPTHQSPAISPGFKSVSWRSHQALRQRPESSISTATIVERVWATTDLLSMQFSNLLCFYQMKYYFYGIELLDQLNHHSAGISLYKQKFNRVKTSTLLVRKTASPDIDHLLIKICWM